MNTPEDKEAIFAAIERRDGLIRIYWPGRSAGKSSLLIEAARRARKKGDSVVVTDLTAISRDQTDSLAKLYLAFAGSLARQLRLSGSAVDAWDEQRSPATNLERYICEHVLQRLSSHLVWFLDEFDIMPAEFRNEILGLFQSWCNAREMYPSRRWSRLTVAVLYSSPLTIP